MPAEGYCVTNKHIRPTKCTKTESHVAGRYVFSVCLHTKSSLLRRADYAREQPSAVKEQTGQVLIAIPNVRQDRDHTQCCVAKANVSMD